MHQKPKARNVNRLIIGHINSNSLRNKFEMLKDCIKGNIDILLISETKLGECFPIGQFQIEDFSTPYRKDRDKNGGGILLYVREDIPSKLVSFKNDDTNIEHFFIGINLRKRNWLLSYSYNPLSNLIETHLNDLTL